MSVCHHEQTVPLAHYSSPTKKPPEIERLLASSLGESYQPSALSAMASCTEAVWVTGAPCG
jgi:hypothetical protein